MELAATWAVKHGPYTVRAGFLVNFEVRYSLLVGAVEPVIIQTTSQSKRRAAEGREGQLYLSVGDNGPFFHI